MLMSMNSVSYAEPFYNYLASSQASSSTPSRTAHSVYRYSNKLDFLSVNFNIVKEFPGFVYNVVYGVFINVKS